MTPTDPSRRDLAFVVDNLHKLERDEQIEVLRDGIRVAVRRVFVVGFVAGAIVTGAIAALLS